MVNTMASGALIIPRSRVIEIRVGAGLELALDSLSCFLIDELRRVNTFRNPKYDQAKRLGHWTGKILKLIKLYQIENDIIHLPRGYFSDLTELLRERDLEYQVEDATICPAIDVQIEPQGELYPYQKKALNALLSRYTGVLEGVTGCGKTNILLSAIAELGTTSLILVHTTELLKQTVRRCQSWLGIEPGIIGGGQFDLRPVTVGMIQTLARRDLEKEGSASYFGCVMIDECHHSPALTWAGILDTLLARYKYGFTATAWRKDGLGFLMWRLIGNKSATINRTEVEAAGKLVWPEIEMVATDYFYDLEDSDQWQAMISHMVRDRERNRLHQAREEWPGHQETRALILSDRIRHVNLLAELLADLDPVVLTGELSKPRREAAMVRVRSGAQLTIATAALLGEGVDVPGWDLLLLASPFSGGPRTLQAVGRIARPSEGKHKALVVDFVDARVPILRVAWSKRQRLYAA